MSEEGYFVTLEIAINVRGKVNEVTDKFVKLLTDKFGEKLPFSIEGSHVDDGTFDGSEPILEESK